MNPDEVAHVLFAMSHLTNLLAFIAGVLVFNG